jgi:hypothetical protein
MDLGQAGQDIVLDSVSEKRVVLFIAEVIEGEHRDTFLHPFGGLVPVEPLKNEISDHAQQDHDQQRIELAAGLAHN